MNRFVTLVTCLVALAASPALAQDTSTAGSEDTGEARTEVAPGGDLALGAPTQPQGPQIYERERFGDFAVRCVRVPEGQTEPCQLFQRLRDAGGNPTADVNFFHVPGDGQIRGGATVVTPLQTLLTAQVRLSVDGGTERIYPFSFCDAQGCYSRMGFTAEEMAQFRAGATATLIVRPALAPDQNVEMTLSLSGFTAGMQAITPAE